ncbi:MAG: uroporphyrinogen decarboxylase family protein [bacterium]
MKGSEIALATLMRERVGEPCVNYCWMTNSSYMSKVAGRDYWTDREGVFYDYLRRCRINLVPQWYFPDEEQRNIEQGRIAHDHLPGGSERISYPEEILRVIDSLPSDSRVNAEFDLEKTARDYAEKIRDRMNRAEGEVLFIDDFGQADFMGGYTRWGYENYLLSVMDYPEAIRRYYHHTALRGRLFNEAIVLAHEKYGIAPFVYGGQDICTSGGPIVSPETLRDLYFPELKWCVEPLVENGIGVIWHCDGNINPILDDILSLGVMGLQGFEEEHGVRYDDIVNIKDRDGRLLSIWGCVSVTTTLPHGTPADVRRSVERSFRLAERNRGFVLSSTSSIMPEAPHENIDAFFEHGREFGREYLSG